jgi:hypothetical protein
MSQRHLRRYTDIPALIYLLTERKISLLDPQSWDDSNDSHYLELYRDKKQLKTVLALCFTQGAETYHHWRVFAGGSSGICIRFRQSALLAAVKKQPGLRAQPVRYLKLNEIRGHPLGVEQLPFLKRYPFGDEKEFRLVYESATKTLPKLDISIPLACISRIIVSPWIHPHLSDKLKEILHSIKGCGALKIYRSTLIGNEQWKQLGDNAR